MTVPFPSIWTIVNGKVTLEDGVPAGVTPDKLLRYGRI
jgi:hypothetical protein